MCSPRSSLGPRAVDTGCGFGRQNSPPTEAGKPPQSRLRNCASLSASTWRLAPHSESSTRHSFERPRHGWARATPRPPLPRHSLVPPRPLKGPGSLFCTFAQYTSSLRLLRCPHTSQNVCVCVCKHVIHSARIWWQVSTIACGGQPSLRGCWQKRDAGLVSNMERDDYPSSVSHSDLTPVVKDRFPHVEWAVSCLFGTHRPSSKL